MKYLIVILILLFSIPALPQDRMEQLIKNPEGTEFWLCFMRNYKDTQSRNQKNNLQLELFITANEDAEVFIEVTSIGYRQRLKVRGGTVQNVKVDPLAQIVSSEVIETDRAVHIKSDKPITVYGLNRRKQTTDTYLGLPKHVLGTEYRAMAYSISEGLISEFAVVATEDDTRVQIIPTVETKKGVMQGDTINITLNQGDVYQVAAKPKPISRDKSDLTGSYIKANKKISVFSGHQCAYVPDKEIACNHLVEQMPPIPSWGKHFYLGMLKPRTNYNFRALANEEGTKLFVDGTFIKTLNSGEFYEDVKKHPIQVAANKPILVTQYSQGFNNGDSIGDPMMILVSPTQQFLKKYRFATPVSGFWEHMVNIVVPTEAISGIVLNGNQVEPDLFEQLGLSRYSIAYIKVDFGTHVIQGTEPFGLYSYGFGYNHDVYDAYGTLGGQSFVDYKPELDTLPPIAEVRRKENSLAGKVIIYDDRINDRGLKRVNIINENLDAIVPQFSAAAPSLSFDAYPMDDNYGRILLEAEDLGGNISIYTICYKYDENLGKMAYNISKGENDDCRPDPGLWAGAHLKLSYINHAASFSSTGGLHAPGIFSNATGLGGYFGFAATRFFENEWALSAKLELENLGGILSAPDSIVSSIRDPDTGGLIPFQETRHLDNEAVFLNFALSGEYHASNFFYVFLGMNFGINLSNSISVLKEIVTPPDYAYANGSSETEDEDAPGELSSFNSIVPGLLGGIGFNYKFMPRFKIFFEAAYNSYLSDIIGDDDWSVSKVSLSAGVKYRFNILD